MTPQQRLKEILARKKAAQASNSVETVSSETIISQSVAAIGKTNFDLVSTGRNGETITYNEKQAEAIKCALEGTSFVLTGPAGSGKTTVVRGIVSALQANDRIYQLGSHDHKYLPSNCASILFVAFTNKAVSNLRRALPPELHRNCITIHKALEYEPVYLTNVDDETGKSKTTMRFEPQRHERKQLPSGITHLVIEETSMLDVPLANKLLDALLEQTFPNLQLIMIGDIQQLPPVFGKSIFIHAMQQGMKTIELTEVHRQALDSPILALAHRILSGKAIPGKELDNWKLKNELGSLDFVQWTKKMDDIVATKIACMWLKEMIEAKKFLPEFDVVLCPQNVKFGCDAFNAQIASVFAKQLRAEVWEIQTATNKVYYRVGERVLYHKSEWKITQIEKNESYYGKTPRRPSATMDYNGREWDESKINQKLELTDEETNETLAKLDRMFAAMSGDHHNPDEDTSFKARAASHIITIYSEDVGAELKISTNGAYQELQLGYAITVHKSQGSEYERVFFLTHPSMNHMLFRELVYTAVTRAKRDLVIMCDPTMLQIAINAPRLYGKNIEEKIAAFDRNMKLLKGSANEDQFPKHLGRFLSVA